VITYWPWLFLVACPLMMMFMMRGMGRGEGSIRRDGRDTRLPGQGSARPPAARPLTADEQTRIAELEQDLAQLRSGGGSRPEDTPAPPR
jgi:hypothetical protein